ncbi:MAG: HEAT repeat domain-containing protein [Bdellovibrionota bacterium]
MKTYKNITLISFLFITLNLLVAKDLFSLENNNLENNNIENNNIKEISDNLLIPKATALETNTLETNTLETDTLETNVPPTETPEEIPSDILENGNNIKLDASPTNQVNETNAQVTIEELSDEMPSEVISNVANSENNKSDSSNASNNASSSDNSDALENGISKIDISNLTSSEIKGLGRKLRTSPKEELQEILEALRALGKNAKPATSEILASIHEKKTSKEAVDILITIGTPQAISGLAKLISNPNKALSNYILENIVKLKSSAQFAIEEIFANFHDEALKKNVINALGEIQGDRAFYELKELLKSQTETEEIKILALKNFIKFTNAKKELPLLRRLYRQSIPSNYADELFKAIETLS